MAQKDTQQSKQDPGEAGRHDTAVQAEEPKEIEAKDALCGLLNREAVVWHVEKRLSAMADTDSCALFLIDLDDFSQVNATLGCQAGDRAIRQAARILSGLFRASDVLGRLGGDEFVAFLAGQIPEKAARAKGAQICAQLQLVLGDAPGITVTASVGICLVQGKGQNFQKLYQLAGAALRQAKATGRRGCCLRRSASFAVLGENDFSPAGALSLSELLENLDSGVSLLEMSETPRLLYISPSFCRLLGVDAEEYIVPRSLAQLVHPDDLSSLLRNLEMGLEQGNCVEHIHRVSADGEHWRWWRIRAARIPYENPYPVMLVTAADISQLKERERRLEEEGERLRLAFSQTDQLLWEVDVQAHTLRFFASEERLNALPEEDAQFPEGIISGGWIHPYSVTRFRAFANELLGGAAQSFGNFIVRNQDTGCYAWIAVSYRMLFGETGGAARAIGVLQKLPQEVVGVSGSGGMRYPLPSAMIAEMVAGFQIDLTEDRLYTQWDEGRDLTSRQRDEKGSRALREEAARIFPEDMRPELLSCFDRDQLLAYFARGEQWFTARYRRVDNGGTVRWVNHTIYMVEDPMTKNIFLSMYIGRQDLRRSWEEMLGIPLRQDPLTHLCETAYAQKVAEMLIGQANGSHMCALAMVQLGGLARMYADDAPGMHRAMRAMAAALYVSIGGDCVLSRYGADRFVAFFPTVHSQFDLRIRLEESLAFVRRLLSAVLSMDYLRLVAGAVCAQISRAEYDVLLNQAAHTCQMWQNAAVDTVAFPAEGDEWDLYETQLPGADAQATARPQELYRPLTGQERDTALRCMSAMLSARSLEDSVQEALRSLGAYYRADRAYVLKLAEGQQVVTMPYEWTSRKKRSIQQAVSGMMLDRFPLLKRCIKERAPVFLSRSPAFDADKEDAGVTWRYTAVPLMHQDEVAGFLCIENAREHAEDAALCSMLAPYLMQERERYKKEGRAVEAESLLNLPNLRSYLEAAGQLDSDHYGSMGVVCMDVPNLSAINSSLGFAYGSQLLQYVVRTLTDIFGQEWIFRTWDSAFLALSPNIMRQAFMGRYARLRTALFRRYPKEVRVGSAWAGGDFQIQSLVQEAQASMREDTTEAAADIDAFILGHNRFRDVADAARAGRFTVYFQPQVDTSTGALVGAEALVRGLDEDGTIIPPGRFIGTLEKSGNIRDLDLFVLNQAMAQMEAWRAAGLGMVKVSVNLSRVSLFAPTTLASILAIASHYPSIPLENVELEITETIGWQEISSLQALMEQFRQCGLHFSLDDFGSKYANMQIFTGVKFDTVKLDRSLIAGMVGNSISQMLVQDIVRICQTCGMACIAEGVETQEQAAALEKMGCRCAQGYYFDRPLPAEQFQQKYLQRQDLARQS